VIDIRDGEDIGKHCTRADILRWLIFFPAICLPIIVQAAANSKVLDIEFTLTQRTLMATAAQARCLRKRHHRISAT